MQSLSPVPDRSWRLPDEADSTGQEEVKECMGFKVAFYRDSIEISVLFIM